MLTKKYYEMIARVLRRCGASAFLCAEFADELAADRREFDRTRFLKACGVANA